jgi:hypothetical protein
MKKTAVELMYEEYDNLKVKVEKGKIKPPKKATNGKT